MSFDMNNHILEVCFPKNIQMTEYKINIHSNLKKKHELSAFLFLYGRKEDITSKEYSCTFLGNKMKLIIGSIKASESKFDKYPIRVVGYIRENEDGKNSQARKN